MSGYLREALQACLPAPYFAVVNQRLWVETSARYIEPDTAVLYGGWTVGESSVAWETAGRTRARPLVEIDLLRGGQHTTPMSWERLSRKAGPFDYHVSVHRFDQRGRFFIYPWRLPDPPPVIGVPLLPGDDEVPLDLQAVLNRCYETGPYRRRVVYEPDRIVPRANRVGPTTPGNHSPTGASGCRRAESAKLRHSFHAQP